MFKKLLNIAFLLLISFSIFQNACFANVAVLKSGNENDFDRFLQTFSNIDSDYKLFNETTIKTINKAETPVLILPHVTNLNSETINSIRNYVTSGGKIIITTIPVTQNLSTIKVFAEIVGVKVGQADKTKNVKYANWIEENFNLNNAFPYYSTISRVTPLKNTEILAVWDEIEKNEPAVTVNQNGSYINWLWGVEGDKFFNIKSLQTIIKKLDPTITLNEENSPNFEDFLRKIQKIAAERKNCEKIYDILQLNKSDDRGEKLQELLTATELNEVSAQDAFLNKNYGYSNQLIDDAQKCLDAAYKLAINSAPVEGRGIWFDRATIVSIKEQDQMSKIFDTIKKAGINAVYFETVNAGYTIYPSEIATQTPDIKGLDPLKWAVEEAKKRNIQIHAWMWVFAGGNDRHNALVNLPDDYPGPALSKHPEWTLIGEEGNTRPDNQHEFWLDPSDQNARNYLISLAEEIVEKYDVDGIHLDYIRYPFQSDSNLMGFNKSSLDQFERDTGFRIMEINQNTINIWNAWKENKINTFVRDISTSLRKTKPDITISAAVFGKSGNYRKSTIQQNWEVWVNNGWVDMLNPMIYATNNEALLSNLAYFGEPINKNVLIYPGIALKNLDVPQIAQQMNIVTNQGLLGCSIFAVSFLNDEKFDFFKDNNKTLPPSKDNLYGASLLLQEYNSYITSFLENSSEIDETHYNNLTHLVSESNSLINQLNSPFPDVKNIKLNMKNFKTSSQNTLKREFKYYPNRLKTLNSYVNRADTLVNLELKKL